MATHAERRLAARAAREAQQHHSSLGRPRLLWLGGVVAAVVIALVAVIVLSTRGSSHGTPISPAAKSSALTEVGTLLAGIPQAGMTLGKADAPITITEFSDIVCPACYDFAMTSERDLIATEVATGHAKLVSRGLETASAIANGGEYTASQTAVRAAGLQGRAWNYLLLAYAEQPQMIGGKSAEEVAYVTPGYLQNLAAQIPGLNLIKWQAGLTNASLVNAVSADARAAQANGVQSTPSLLVSGPVQTVRITGAPTLAQVQTAMRQAAGG